MKEIFGSHVKASLLLYLGLRGGTSGRELARILKIHPTQIFKALKQLTSSGILKYYQSLYAINPFYIYHDELIRMIWKEAEKNKKFSRRFLPTIADDRRVDPLAIYELAALRKQTLPYPKLSDVLRKKYG